MKDIPCVWDSRDCKYVDGHCDGSFEKCKDKKNYNGYILYCKHRKTHYEEWPDGGTIEVCEYCGMSQHHWEWGHSDWVMVKDIERARKEVQAGIDKIKEKWSSEKVDPIEDIKAGFDRLSKIDQPPNRVLYIGPKLFEAFMKHEEKIIRESKTEGISFSKYVKFIKEKDLRTLKCQKKNI